MTAFAEQFAAAVVLCCAALLLAARCLRHRAVLGLFCATLAAGLAAAVPLGLGSDPTELLVGSAVACVTGTVLLVLGVTVQRLLDDAPGEARDIRRARQSEATR